jgi:hypothetical protein
VHDVRGWGQLREPGVHPDAQPGVHVLPGVVQRWPVQAERVQRHGQPGLRGLRDAVQRWVLQDGRVEV